MTRSGESVVEQRSFEERRLVESRLLDERAMDEGRKDEPLLGKNRDGRREGRSEEPLLEKNAREGRTDEPGLDKNVRERRLEPSAGTTDSASVSSELELRREEPEDTAAAKARLQRCLKSADDVIICSPSLLDCRRSCLPRCAEAVSVERAAMFQSLTSADSSSRFA